MQIEHLLDNYTSAGDVGAFFVCVLMLILIQSVLFFGSDKKFTYLKRAVHFIMIGTITNIVFSTVVYHYKENIYFDISILVLRAVYHFCFMCCLYLFVLYIKKMLSVEGGIVKAVTICTRVILVVALIADITSPLTKFGFHKEGDLWYDPIISPYNIFYVYGVLLLFFMLFLYSDRLIRSVRNSLIVTEVLVLIIMAKGAIDNSNTLTSITYVMPIIVVLVLLHSNPFDEKTGALSISSYNDYMSHAMKKNTSFDYMVLQLNLSEIDELPDELGKVLNSFWHNSFRNAELFHDGRGLFVLTIPRTSMNGDTQEKIRLLMDNDFQQYYNAFQLKYKVVGLYDIDFIHSEADVKNMFHYVLSSMDENQMLIADEKMKEQLRMIHTIMEHLIDIANKEDLDDPRVLAYCQPIRNIKTKCFDTGEALMRLSLPEKGFIMPYLFIPIAEHNGMIHSLTKIMLNKVCKEILALDKEGYQFKRISINFAATEIKAEGFCEEILSIVRASGVDPSRIGIELTESQSAGDFEIIKERIRCLREAGMTVYLDDVGTGYSNLDRIVRYDVDVVKFDRFFLMEAEKDKRVEKMMKHMSEAFQDLNYTLLYEGVETVENEELCMECGAEYIQGFKYSKPLPIEEMRDFFDKK